MKLSKLKLNPDNPQVFGDLEKLKNSIKEFPKMMKLRPLVYDPATGYVLGGNKRLVCLRELEFKEIPDEWVRSADELTEEEKKRFIIADNLLWGEFDWDKLKDEWDIDELENWGLDVPNFDASEDEWQGMPDFDKADESFKIVIHFDDEETREKYAEENKMQFVKTEKRTWSTWFPFRERDDLTSLKYQPEESQENELTDLQKTNYPIYVLSKDRAGGSTTADILIKNNIEFEFVVEEQDFKSYLEAYPKTDIIVLPKNDQGIAYARNFCIEHSKEMGFEYHWQLDDNIKNFQFKDAENKRNTVDPFGMLRHTEEHIDQYMNIGGACFSHGAFAFGFKNDIDYNKMIFCCQLINNSIETRFKKGTAEDVDFSAQLLTDGWCSIIFRTFLINKPKIGTQKGGNENEYKEGGRESRNKQLQKDWPRWFKEYKKNGESRIRPSRIWSSFKQRPILKDE